MQPSGDSLTKYVPSCGFKMASLL